VPVNVPALNHVPELDSLYWNWNHAAPVTAGHDKVTVLEVEVGALNTIGDPHPEEMVLKITEELHAPNPSLEHTRLIWNSYCVPGDNVLYVLEVAR
jgi:hypothetical protein